MQCCAFFLVVVTVECSSFPLRWAITNSPVVAHISIRRGVNRGQLVRSYELKVTSSEKRRLFGGKKRIKV